MPVPEEFVAGLVLAAGGSSRLGQPKQLLPYRTTTLLDHVLGVARACAFDQLICVIGGGRDDVRAGIDFDGVVVAENPAFASGCSSSIATALAAVDSRADALVIMLGDQPGVSVEAVHGLLAGRGSAPIAACAYADGRGHPLVFGRAMFSALASMHGDKAVWKLMDRFAPAVVDVPVPGPVPRDLDTWADYEAMLAGSGQLEDPDGEPLAPPPALRAGPAS
jgi:molybdenum cofactor cytidylyltransferase